MYGGVDACPWSLGLWIVSSARACSPMCISMDKRIGVVAGGGGELGGISVGGVAAVRTWRLATRSNRGTYTRCRACVRVCLGSTQNNFLQHSAMAWQQRQRSCVWGCLGKLSSTQLKTAWYNGWPPPYPTQFHNFWGYFIYFLFLDVSVLRHFWNL